VQVSATEAPPKEGFSLRARTLALCLLLMVANIFWITVIEVRWYSLDVTSLPIFITPIFCLMVAVGVNRWLWRVRPAWALRPAELVLLYIAMVTGAVFAGHDMLQNLFGAIGHAQWRSQVETGWRERFFEYIPKPLFVWDMDALRPYYYGGSLPYRWEWLRVWVLPLTLWAGFILTLVGMFLCLNYLVLDRWTREERLAFPLVQLPLAMVEPSGAFWHSKAMWAGFTTALAVSGLNGVHVLVPSLPNLPWIKQYEISFLFPDRPWSAMNPIRIATYPFAIGLVYLMPPDLGFSAWFFFVMRKLFQVFGATMGWDSAENRGFPFLNEQAAGAWLALGLILLARARHAFSDAWRIAWSREEHPNKALFRACWLGLAGGIGVLTLYNAFVLHLSGWVAALFFGIYFLLALTITRVRAELGAPHEIYFVNPQRILFDVFTLRGLGTENLTVLQSLYWFNRGYRCHPMPNQLESLRMAQEHHLSPVKMGIFLLGCSVVAFGVVCWANLHVTYLYGAEGECLGFKNWVGQESFGRLDSWLQNEPFRHPNRWYYLAGGALVVAGLSAIRSVVPGFPLHPTGYALGVSFAVDYFWFAFMLGWVLKMALIRFGGWYAHRLGYPFALGLILGDFTMGSLWSLITLAFQVPTYRIYI
jgi:hypothetical protein